MKGLQLIVKGRKRIQTIKRQQKVIPQSANRDLLAHAQAAKAVNEFERGYRLLGK
tara:strand:+ start:390 stop:554 length:165 start_codon:yes stop_codon:yes gene_type:complete